MIGCSAIAYFENHFQHDVDKPGSVQHLVQCSDGWLEGCACAMAQSPMSDAPKRRVRRKTAPPQSPTLGDNGQISQALAEDPAASVQVSPQGEGPEKRKQRESRLLQLFKWPLRMLSMYVRYRDARKAKGQHCRLTSQLVDTLRRSGGHTECGNCVNQATKDEVLINLRDRLEATTMSTAFSGIDTPATAFLMVSEAVAEGLEMKYEEMPRPRNHYAIEWLGASQNELAAHPHEPDHIFADISDFWHPSVRSRLNDILDNHMVESVLMPLIHKGKATVTRAWCVKHQRICEAGGCS